MIFFGASPILHAGSGHQITFLAYLYRIVLLLIMVGGVAVFLDRLVEAIPTGRTEDPAEFEGEESE